MDAGLELSLAVGGRLSLIVYAFSCPTSVTPSTEKG